MKRVFSPLKICLFIVLTTLSMGSFAGVYVGNATRPNTIWIPGHCAKHGCFREGYYVKFMDPPVCCHHVRWIQSSHDRCGNWVPGHFRPRHYVVVGMVK